MSRKRAPSGFKVSWPPDLPAEISADGDTLKNDPRHTIVPRTAQRTGPSGSERAASEISRLAAETRKHKRLVIGDILGQGGMAVVRLGTQVSLGRDVAVKSLPPAKKHSSDSVIELMQEAWITGALEHPNVVPIYDVEFDEKGIPQVLLKRIEGQPWRELMDDAAAVRERFGAGDLLEWNLGVLMHVLNAVRFAHSRGIVHRDLKPDNVMIGEFGEVYLVDWGIAVSLVDDGSGRLPLAQNARALAGTPMYMAPEMLPGVHIPLSERTDIYLIGAILCEILTGVPPHVCETLTELGQSVMASNPALPDQAPARLVAICRRAMDPDPDGRFENAEQVRLAIQGYLRHRGTTRLLSEASARLDELDAAVKRAGPDNLDHRQRIYKLYGECRFGFREASSSWKENTEAHDGLARAARIMIDYELGSGDARAAAALLADVAAPPAALAERISRALADQNARRLRLARLEKLGRAMDMNTGSKFRRSLILILGAIWVTLPLVNQWLPGHGVRKTHLGIALTTGVFLLLSLFLAVLVRRILFESLVNRRYFATLVFVYVAHGILQLGMLLGHMPPDGFQVVSMLVTFVVVAMLAVTMDVRLWPMAAGFAAAFLVTARWPDMRFFAQSGAALVLTVNAFAIWKPGPAKEP